MRTRSKDCVKGHEKVATCKPSPGFRGNQSCWHLDPEIPASRTMRKYISINFARHSVVFFYDSPSKLMQSKLINPVRGREGNLNNGIVEITNNFKNFVSKWEGQEGVVFQAKLRLGVINFLYYYIILE